MYIKRIAQLAELLQTLQQHTNVLIENRHKLIHNIVRERRIQQLAMSTPNVAFRRHQTDADKFLYVFVRITLIDACGRVEDDLRMLRIVNVNEQSIAQPQFAQISPVFAVILHPLHDFCKRRAIKNQTTGWQGVLKTV